MRIRSTMLLLAAALAPVAAAFRARPDVVAPSPSTLPVSWTAVPYQQPVRTGSLPDVRMPTRFLIGDIAFASDSNGLVVGGIGQTLHTRDGGVTWTYAKLPVNNLLNGVAAVDAASFIAVGSGGAILRSEDGGASWRRIESGTTQHLRDVAFADTSFGVAVGMWGTVLVSEDGGRSWRPENSGTRSHLTRVAFDGAGTAIATDSAAAIAVQRTAHAD